jgi:hypothetical protein
MKKIILIVGILVSQFTFANYPINKTIFDDVETSEIVVLDESDSVLARKSQQTTLILCALVGGIGVHRYYLGDIWQGVVQTVTLGGLGIWSLIDLIRICTGDLGPGW